MSTPKRAPTLPRDLLTQLSRALDAENPESALGDVLGRSTVPEAVRARVVERALRVGQRARQRGTRGSSSEVELSLGVLLVLCGALASDAIEATP